MTSKPLQRYQDFVIKDGKLVGDFEGLYQNFDDPWHQSKYNADTDTRKHLARHWMHRLRNVFAISRVIELGCGFGHLTHALQQDNFSSLGIDISQIAIDKAKKLYPNSEFIKASITEFNLLAKFEPDVFIMAEITWYILANLDEFIENLHKYSKKRSKPTFLIHLLSTYPAGIQQYGKDKFTNLDEILAYFQLPFLEAGLIRTFEEHTESQGTYFVARIA